MAELSSTPAPEVRQEKTEHTENEKDYTDVSNDVQEQLEELVDLLKQEAIKSPKTSAVVIFAMGVVLGRLLS